MGKKYFCGCFRSKGKIFGKFNLFDILVALFIILCVVAAIVKVANPKITSSLLFKESQTQEVLITVALDEGMGWIFDDMLIGDFQKGRQGEPIYEIVSKEFRSIPEGGKRIFVKLKVKAVVEPGGVLSVRGSALKKGQGFFFESAKIMFTGKITKIEIP